MKSLVPVLAAVGLASCASREVAPVPDVAMASRSGVDSETLRRGHSVYLANCGRCHEYIMPKDFSNDVWHVVVPGMAWNAGISRADEKALKAYLLAAR